MPSIWVSVMGGVLLLVLVVDVLQTTLGSGAGPLTNRLTAGLWRLVLLADPRRRRHEYLAIAGVAVTMAAIGMWIVLLWMGWTLVFSGASDTVVTASGRVPVGFWHRLYFTGFTVFTLGTGDYVARTPLWQNLMVVASGSGLFLITLSITYLTPVVQAVTHRRATASRISSLGMSPQAILLGTWDGRSCKVLEEHLASLAGDIAQIEQRHLAYPVLHYFHSTREQDSVALRVAALDEALTILELAFPRNRCMAQPHLNIVRKTIANLLTTLQAAFIHPADEPPPLPELHALREAGMPACPDAELAAAVPQVQHRRRLLRAWVENDGWRWEHVVHPTIGA